jgi:putative molybdopterin biosynthesis protein
MRVENRLVELRKSRGIAATDLARRAGIGRQTIYAIEAGTYVPNTAVALHLARELEVSVEELFTLAAEAEPAGDSLPATVLSAGAPLAGQPVRLCKAGSRWVGVPVSAVPYYLPEADGVVREVHGAGTASLTVFAPDEVPQKRLVIAGCDPAMGLLAPLAARAGGVEIVCAPASSKLALGWLRDGLVSIAGSHLEDAKTGEFNLPFVHREFPGEDLCVVTFARWEEGLVVRHGNPKGVRTVEDLARKNVAFVNREPGSGSRALLDKLLKKAGIGTDQVRGYARVAYGHLVAASMVASGAADACLATRCAAQSFGLDFEPLHSERYDLVMRKCTADLPAVQAFLDLLQRATLRRKLQALAGYDTSQTGLLIG